MERFKNGSDVCGFRSLNNSTSKRVLNLLEPVKLTDWKVMTERVTVVKFSMNDGGGNAGCFEVEISGVARGGFGGSTPPFASKPFFYSHKVTVIK